ncbi:hypothetical protein J4558_06440 [Leptolyngbya sp. 15MV]|nr:hypothetical protein J4558_06440 [Leptolyngbya sp. 15MV]
MTGSATVSCNFARAAGLAFLIAAVPAAAQNQPVAARDRDPTVRDIAVTPIQDLNLARDEIPAVLLQAAVAPYDAEGLAGCDAIAAAIAGLDEVLGADMDIAAGQSSNISVGRVAKSAVGSLIPFRGIIREITGAADHQRQFEEAIYAGAVRRGFLKGMGQQRGCAYPARPAFANVQVTRNDVVAGEASPAQLASNETRSANGTSFVSQPVVQGE